MIWNILLWGFVIGIIHFVIVGVLYGNPFIGKIYKDAQDHPGVKKWPSQASYMIKMFLGTQIEVYIMTAAYFIIRGFFSEPFSLQTAAILAALFCGIRVYPRFWNMWIQSTYPNKLLLIEAVNGTIGTFIIVLGLYLFPVI
ncbi:MAG: hypothetical protein A2Y33_01035 [Spirochaetes bacterium GWF1_51_8]|nr:MAG: hypothetical protein A2Y33_01035 [Spirochaetes bacterium GWF1_51_8]